MIELFLLFVDKKILYKYIYIYIYVYINKSKYSMSIMLLGFIIL